MNNLQSTDYIASRTANLNREQTEKFYSLSARMLHVSRIAMALMCETDKARFLKTLDSIEEQNKVIQAGIDYSKTKRQLIEEGTPRDVAQEIAWDQLLSQLALS